MTDEQDQPVFAPFEMPDFVPNEPSDPHPAHREWGAVPAGERGELVAVVIKDSVKRLPDGRGTGLMVAMCPSPDIAQYIAYMHNMVLKGNGLLGVAPDTILKAYSTMSDIPQPEPEPDHGSTGMYL